MDCIVGGNSHGVAMPDSRVPKINGVVETVLYVDDLSRAVAFYRDLLGLTPMRGDPERFHAFDSGQSRVLLLFKRGATLETTETPGGNIPPHDGHGPLHIAFAIAATDYESWRSRLREQSVVIISEVHWDSGGRSLYFHDPDGNVAELVTPGIWPNY